MTVSSKGSLLRASFSCPVAQPDPSGAGELFNSDGDDLPSFTKILARAKQVIDLTLDDDQGSDGNDDNVTEVSWLRIMKK
jgi:hypothetical protein